MDGPLPVPTPINRDRCCHCQRRDGTNQGAVCHPAVVPAPRALLGVTDKILAGDVVMVADLGSAHAGEERFRAVRVDICGRPLLGKRKLQDCRGAWSDAAICPASAAAASCRGPVWEFADRVHINAACSRHVVAAWLSRSRLADRCAISSFRSPLRPRGCDQPTLPRPELCIRHL